MENDPWRRSASDINTEMDHRSGSVFMKEVLAKSRVRLLKKHWGVVLFVFICVSLSIASISISIKALHNSSVILRDTDVKVVQQLKTTVSELQIQIQKHLGKLKRVEEKVESSSHEHRSKAQTHSEELETLKIAINENENLVRELQNFTEFENAELSKKIQSNTEQLTNLQEEMKKTKDDLEHLRNSSENFDTMLEEQLAAEVIKAQMLSEKIGNLENLLKSLPNRVSQVELANRNLENRVDALSEKPGKNASVQNKPSVMGMVFYTIFCLFLLFLLF